MALGRDPAEERVEQEMGRLLKDGVSVSAAVVFAGGVLYLAQCGPAAADYAVFHGEPEDLRHVTGIIQSAAHLDSRGLIQLGLLLLIATPVARVVLALVAFVRQRDILYTAVTAVVLALLVYSLFGRHP